MDVMTKSYPRLPAAAIVCLLLLCHTSHAQISGENNRKVDSRSPFVHRININDERGLAINAAETQRPYSPMATCSPCHPTVSISHGWHFNAVQNNVPAGRNGEPWIFSDATTRSNIPLSYRDWLGTRKPREAGLSAWDMTVLFGRHMPGGSFGSPPSNEPADPKARWQFSGRLEIDCMICHAAGTEYDPTERAIQVMRMENFKWAPSVALGLAHVSGSAKALGLDDEEEEEADPKKPKATPTLRMSYDKSKFDAQNKVHFDVVRAVPDGKCYFCHTVNHVETPQTGAVTPGWLREGDVHVVNGLHCVDCHREDVLHKTTRGFEGEAALRNEPALASLTCAGCHMGTGEGGVPLAGRLGSPIPEHKGLPPIHFERLSCTACHSGPWPDANPVAVQTSMAHVLGLDLPNRKPDTLPRIVEPVFLKADDGKIYPHRVTWPNFWGRLNGDRVDLIPPKAVAAAAKGVLPPTKETDPAATQPLTDEQILKTLAALEKVPAAPPQAPVQAAAAPGPATQPAATRPTTAPTTATAASAATAPTTMATTAASPPAPAVATGEAVYISGGKIYRRGGDGQLTNAEHPAAAPYAWPLGHDVRPAGQSLGVRGCADCHSDDAPIYFAKLTPLGPVNPQTAAVKYQHELRHDDIGYMSAFAGSFQFRTMLKVMSFAAAAVIAFVLLAYGVRGLNVATRRG